MMNENAFQLTSELQQHPEIKYSPRWW